MDISVGTTADVKPEINIGKLLQMVKKAGLDKSAAKEDKADALGNSAEDGNVFLQVLQQKLAALMQPDSQGSQTELMANQELSAALEKLLKEDEASSGEIISGLALLANFGKMEEPVAAENDISEESITAWLAAGGITGILKEEIDGNPDQTTLAMVENEKGILISKAAALTADAKTIQPDMTGELKTKSKSDETPLQGQSVSLKEIQTGAMSVHETAEESVSVERPDKAPIPKVIQENSLPQTNSDAGRQLLREDQPGKTFDTDKRENNQNEYADVHKKAVSEKNDKTIKFKNPEEIISAAGKAPGENESAKVNPGAAAVQENKNLLNISDNMKTEEENPIPQNIQNQTGEDVRKKLSIRAEASLAEKQASAVVNETQKNTGKVTAAMPESTGVIDKFKTEFRSKTASTEKNIDMSSLNSLNLSGVSAEKTATSDISPAQIINRVAAAFNESLASEGGRIKITLAPPSLGTLEMDVMVRNGAVKVMLTADNQDVQKILSGNLDSLKGSLQSQGLTIERCDVMMQDRREQYQQGFNQQAFHQEQSTKQHNEAGETYNPNTRTDRTTVTPIATPVNQATWRSGNISIFA